MKFQQLHLQKKDTLQNSFVTFVCTMRKMKIFMKWWKNIFSKNNFHKKTSDKILTIFCQNNHLILEKFISPMVQKFCQNKMIVFIKNCQNFVGGFLRKSFFKTLIFLKIIKLIISPILHGIVTKSVTKLEKNFRGTCWKWLSLTLVHNASLYW
mgnify:CR=1 FL=1